jgi:hypothetical protein
MNSRRRDRRPAGFAPLAALRSSGHSSADLAISCGRQRQASSRCGQEELHGKVHEDGLERSGVVHVDIPMRAVAKQPTLLVVVARMGANPGPSRPSAAGGFYLRVGATEARAEISANASSLAKLKSLLRARQVWLSRNLRMHVKLPAAQTMKLKLVKFVPSGPN